MSDTTRRKTMPRSVAVAALALGLVGGGYGIAGAANGSSASASASAATTTTTATSIPTTSATAPAPPTGGPTAGSPWGGQRSDETPLTGDALGKVTAIANDKVPGGTIVRVETDADGNAAYEAHMTNASGAPVTVYVDKDFNFVSVQTR